MIGPRWILTAAHCFDHFNPADFTVIAGKINRLFARIKVFYNRNGRIEVTPHGYVILSFEVLAKR